MSMSSEELFITHTNTSFLGPTLQILPAQLFNVLNEGTGITNNMPIGNQMGKSLGIGTTILIFVSAAYFLFRKNKKIKDEKFILVLFFAGLTALWMATTYFPWTLLYKIPIIEHAVGKMQYSWRFLSIVSAIICITGSAVIAYFCRTRIHKILSVILMLLICFIGIANFYSNYMKIATVFEKNTCPWIVTLDYSYVNVDVNQLKANQYESDAFDVVDAKKKGAKIDMTVSPKSAASGGQVKVPLSYYPGFTVKDKDNHTLEYTKSDNGVLAVELPAGYSGEVKIRYTGMLLWHFTDVFSLLSLAAVLVYIKTGGKIIRRT